MIHLDSHIAIWAYGSRTRLSTVARRLLADEACQLSAAVLLEIDGLFKQQRIAWDADMIFSNLRRQIELSISEAPFIEIVGAARTFAWTRDPFDRLIVANAMADGVRLLTADAYILRHFENAVW